MDLKTAKTLDGTKDRILEAAGPIFAAKGFDGTTVRDICKNAKVNLAAVNYHFRDKERLYIESVKRAHRQRVEQVPVPNWPPGTSPADKLRSFIRMLLTRMVSDQAPHWHMQLMMRELLQPTEACVELVRDFIRPHFEILLSILDQLLPKDVSAVDRHLTAFSIVGQCLHYRVARPIVSLLVHEDEFRTYDADRLAKHISNFTLAALQSKYDSGHTS